MKSLFIDVRSVLKHGATFNFVFGGRGIGKTYSALDICRNLQDEFKTLFGVDIGAEKRFMLMRRTGNEVDMLSDNSGNPFKKLNEDKADMIAVDRVNKNILSFSRDKEGLGYAVGLSTFAGVRGMDFSDVVFLIFDEFIPEKHVKRIKAEGRAFLNAYETINRNRELFGELPVKCLILTNSNDINSDLLLETGLLRKCETMLSKGQKFSHLPDYDVTISFMENADFRMVKRETALYKFARHSEFSKMALDNEFVDNDFSYIGSRNLKNFQLVLSVGDRFIYRSDSEFYVTTHGKAGRFAFEDNDVERRQVLRDFGKALGTAYINGYIVFETYALKKWFVQFFMGKQLQKI